MGKLMKFIRRTTALVNTIAGLDDFELVAFLVVQEER